MTTARETALPLTSKGNISEMSSQDIGPKPIWYPPMYTNKERRMTIFCGVRPVVPQHTHPMSGNPISINGSRFISICDDENVMVIVLAIKKIGEEMIIIIMEHQMRSINRQQN